MRVDHPGGGVGNHRGRGVFRQARRAEALGGGRPQHHPVGRLPADAELGREGIAKVVVMVKAGGGIHLQPRGQRQHHFGIGRMHVTHTVGFGNGRADLQAGIDLPRVVRIQVLAAELVAGGKADAAVFELTQGAGGLGVDAQQARLGRTHGGQGNAVNHRRRRGRRVEQVVAAIGQGVIQRPAVGKATGHGFTFGAGRAVGRHFPVPVFGVAAQPGQRAPGLGAVGLQRLAQVEEGVFQGHVLAIRVVRAGSGQDGIDRLGQAGVGIQGKAARFQGEVRAGTEPRRAFQVTVEQLAEGLDVVAQALAAGDIALPALGRGNQGGRVVEVVGAGLPAAAVDRRAVGEHGAGRAVAVGIEQRHRDPADQETGPLGRPAVQPATGQVAVVTAGGQLALAVVQPLAVVAFQREQHVPAIGLQVAQTANQLGALRAHVALPGLAGAGAHFQALEILPGDDVDHPGHRIGAVHRAGAVLEHLDALHRHQRQGIDVDEGVRQAAIGEAVVGQAAAVEQDQGVLAAQPAQADAGRAGGPTRVLGFIGATTGVGRDRAQQLGGGLLAGLGNLLAADHLHRVGGFGVGALDVGTGDLHRIQGAAGIALFQTLGGMGGGRQGKDGGNGSHQQ